MLTILCVEDLRPRLIVSPAELGAIRCSCRTAAGIPDHFVYIKNYRTTWPDYGIIKSPWYSYRYDAGPGNTKIWYGNKVVLVLSYKYLPSTPVAYSRFTQMFAMGDAGEISRIWRIFRLSPAERPRKLRPATVGTICDGYIFADRFVAEITYLDKIDATIYVFAE